MVTTDTSVAGMRGSKTLVSRRDRKLRPDRWWWPFVVPALALTVIFFLLPFLLNVYFAFTDWTGYNSGIALNGLSNFVDLWTSGTLSSSIAVTVGYAVFAMVVQNVISLSLALLLQRTARSNSVLRAVYFLPVLISPLAAGYIWSAMLAPAGPINQGIALIVPGFNFAWLGSPVTALMSVAFIDVWKWSGIVTLVYIAGLNTIPRSLVEAAMIDGTSAWKRFWSVRFPLLAPAFTFSVVVTFLGALNAFDIVQATTLGGPGDATTVLNIALFRQYTGGLFGSASALSLVIALLVVILGIPLIMFLRNREVES